MRYMIWLPVVAMLASFSASAQGIMGDVLSGNLVSPAVGAYAWYDLTDTATKKTMYVRQAIVGEEKVDKKKGYWVETEIVPQVGYPSVYKMLLTGPASDVANVHKIVAREGNGKPEEIPVAKPENAPKSAEPERKSLGKESLPTEQGALEAEHFEWEENGHKTDLWLNESVPPMGIVKMTAPEGSMLLRRWGTGGPDGQSAMDRAAPAPPETGSEDVKVQVEAPAKKNFKGKSSNEKK